MQFAAIVAGWGVGGEGEEQCGEMKLVDRELDFISRIYFKIVQLLISYLVKTVKYPVGLSRVSARSI